MNLKGKILEIGFEDLEEAVIKYNITVTTSGNFQRRLWLIKQITRVYMTLVKLISKGVCVGDLTI